MRSFALTIIVAIACLSWPAYGAKYRCTFLQDGTIIGEPCQIDSNGANNSTCERIYNRTLAGKCFVTSQNEQLNCVFYNQTSRSKKPTTKPVQAELSNAPQVFSEEPGFVTGAGTWSARSLTVGYKRNKAGPTLLVTCGTM
jgi:hypothetical protein